MDSFVDALLSGKTDRIPDEYDWFAPLIGDWDCDYYDEPEEGRNRHVKGEWLFRRILEGTGVQDIFIFPSRATKETSRNLMVNMARRSGCSTRLSGVTTLFILVTTR